MLRCDTPARIVATERMDRRDTHGVSSENIDRTAAWMKANFLNAVISVPATILSRARHARAGRTQRRQVPWSKGELFELSDHGPRNRLVSDLNKLGICVDEH